MNRKQQESIPHSGVPWVWFMVPGARSEIGAPFPDFSLKIFKNGRPKTNLGHFQK